MTHDEMIAVIEHHKNGGKVQHRMKGTSEWKSCSLPLWVFNVCDYRIKPDPVERWAVEYEDGYVGIFNNKDVAETNFYGLSRSARMFKMREVEDNAD